MQRCKIIYKRKPCLGYIIASTEILPHYYWFVFDDLEFIKLFGDAVAFVVEKDQLVPTRLYCGDESFIEKIKEAVEVYRKETSPDATAFQKQSRSKAKSVSKPGKKI